MSKHDEARRAFLVGAAVTGAAAGAVLVPEAYAKDDPRKSTQKNGAAEHAHAMGGGHGAFLNDADSMTIDAVAERIMPGAPGKPGAHEAGVLNYIDLALAGAYQDQQDFYRRGLAALESYCQATYKQSFAQLPAAKQDEVVGALAEGKATGFTWPSAQAFFNTLRTHTMEGMFADPVYGGNKDFVGWRLVGFPGAQPTFTAADMQSRQPFTRAPIVGLQSQAKGPSKRT